MTNQEKEPRENGAHTNWDTKARYEYLQKMSSYAISALEANGFTITSQEAETFLKLFAIELKFNLNISNQESNF